MIWFIGMVLVWFGIGYVAGCNHYAYFQKKYWRIADDSRAHDTRMAYAWMGFGPIAMLVCLIMGMAPYGLLTPGSKPTTDGE